MSDSRERLYVEMHCTGCKRPHMVTRQALQDPKVIKKCPHCLSAGVHATGMLGFTATNAEIKEAVQKGIDLRREHPELEAQLTARTAANHARLGTVLNPEG